MRNFLFSALACVAFAGSGFASNEVVSEIAEIETVTTSVENNSAYLNTNISVEETSNDRKPCSYTIVYSDRSGNRITVTGQSEGNVSAVVCSNIVSNEVKNLENLGARVHSFSSEWG